MFLQSLLDRFGADRRVVLAGVGIGTAVLIWLVSYWATRPDWVTLLPGMPLEMVGEATTRLDEAKIGYRLARGGAELRVAETDLARARVLLAQAGMPSQGRPGFELFDQPSWGMTDFTQRINYRRALEGELERTISQMRGIESAQVHLAMHETTVFRRSERSSEASVFLRLRPGIRPNNELVEAITFLVAGSVDGLTSDKVTVLDDSGRILSAAVESGLASGLTKRQLALQREVESYLQAKAEDLVGEVVGAGNVRVRISAILNFDHVNRTTQMVDPDQQVAMREGRSQITPAEGGPNAASTVENTSYEVTRTVEHFTGGQGNLRRLTVAVLVNNRLVGTGKDLRSEPRTAEELHQLELLVRNSVGIDATRGDEISVVSVPFDGGSVLAPRDQGPGILAVIQDFQRLILGVIALVLVFIVAMRVIRTQGRSAPETIVAELSAPVAAEPEVEEPEELDEEPERLPKPLVPRELEGRAQVRATISTRPENAVRVLRAWLREVRIVDDDSRA